MSESSQAGQPPSAESLVQAAAQVSDLEISQPDKVEILAINSDQALVRVIAADGDVESRIVRIERPKSEPPAASDERTATSQGADA